MKTFNCIFPGLYNYILAKDVGMIPYALSDVYDTSITTYDNDSYTYLKSVLDGKVKLNFLKKNGDDEQADVLDYIKSNAKDIDVIQFYHLRYNLLPSYIRCYRKYNKDGKIYLKLDANNHIIDFLIKRHGIKAALRRYFTKKMFKEIDLISIETKRNYHVLKNSELIDPEKLIYLPDGIKKIDINFKNRQNIILYVGKIERKNKSVDMLLKAASDTNMRDWKIMLIGEIEDDMKIFMKQYFKENPGMIDKVILKGYITDKEELSQYYAKAKVYCCCSKTESFGIALLEAAYHGNYIISTDVGASYDIINLTKYGMIINHNTQNLKNTLEYVIKNWNHIQQDPRKISNTIYEHYGWPNLAKKLEEKLK